MAHCWPHTLASWDCQERIEALRRGGSLSSTQGSQRRASQPRRRSRSSSQCSQTPAQGDRDEHSHGPSPCTPSRCHCRATLSPSANTMPKLALAVNVPSHAQSSHSSEGMAQASLNDEDAWDDDFQAPHTPVHHIVWREDGSHGEPVDGRMEASRRSLAGNLVTRWILVRRRPHLKPLTLPGDPPAGFNWWSRASLMMRCPGMNWSSL